jgi:DNA-binding PadR family transcriptional regulator
MYPHFYNRVAAVPKGFLRYYILKLLAEKPMSGTEMSQEIEMRTEGMWKPSPGSIYPLLSRLNKKACIQKMEKSEVGLRYMIIEKGKFLLDEMKKNREEARKKEAGILPLFIGYFEPSIHPQRIIHLNKSVGNLLTCYWNLLDALRERYSNKMVEEAINTINQTVHSIEELVKRLEHET